MTELEENTATEPAVEVKVRRLHRRDLNRTWEFLKLVFRDVNRETVEYQRPRSKKRFLDIYEEDEAEQLLFEAENEVVGYAECTFEISMGSDNWLNPRYFDKRDMRPMFVDELAVHPRMQGRGVGGFMIDQLQHLARLRGCTHLVLEVAENNRDALMFYRHRGFQKMDAAIFMAQKIDSAPDLLPPRKLKGRENDGNGSAKSKSSPPKKTKRKPREVEIIALADEVTAKGLNDVTDLPARQPKGKNKLQAKKRKDPAA
ncbi:MAG TPA: GNAT family N-acetyltransferase [Polyangiales bacterium]|nr:GNAT family N-acetyltransferase [Polyangiales bacterium]